MGEAGTEDYTETFYTMSLLRTVGKGVAWTVVGTVVNKVLVLANVLIILNHLTVFNYGVAELVFSMASMASIILLPGLTATIAADMGVERGRGNTARMKALFLQYVLLVSGLALIAFSLLYFGSAVVAAFSGNASIQSYIQIVAWTLLISPLRSVSQMLANVHGRFVDQALYSTFEEVAKTVTLVLFFFVFGMGVEGLLYSVVASQIVAVVLFIPRTISGYWYFGSATAEKQYRFWQLLGSHRKWSILAGYVGNITQNLQLWIIKFFLGTEAVGLFAFALGIYSNVSSLLPFSSVFASLAPRYIEKKQQFIGLIRSSVKAQFLSALVLIVATFVGLPILMIILPKYLPAMSLTLVLIFAIIPTATTAVFTPTFAILKEQFSFFLTMLVKLLLTVTVMPLSIMAFGIMGIGVGSLIINTSSGFERYLRLRSKLSGFSLSLRDVVVPTAYQYSVLRTLGSGIFSRTGLSKLVERTEA